MEVSITTEANDLPDLAIKEESEVIMTIKTEANSSAIIMSDESKNAEESINNGEDSEVDVPTDFFDDFNNKDFLAGLDVVDAWEDEEVASTTIANEDQSQVVEKATETEKPEIKEDGEAHKETHDKEIVKDKDGLKTQENVGNEDNATSKEKKPKRYVIPKKKSGSKECKPRQETNIGKDHERRKYTDSNRRDPEKVNRDIQRDKAKCEKERITEKLRIVETGLVPPGTEMDLPDSSTESAVTHETRHKPGQHTDRSLKDPVGRAGARPASKRQFSRSPSPYRRKRRYSRSRSPQAISRKKYSPPVYRRRSRTRSPIPANFVSRYEDRERERRKRLRSGSRSRNRSSRSLSRERRYSKLSRSSTEPHDRHSAKLSVELYDRSPEIRKQSFLEELDWKLARNEHDRLQNIKAQLNGDTFATHVSHNIMNPIHHNMMVPNPTIIAMLPGHVPATPIITVPAPQMVPAPVMAMDHNQYGGVQYDQSYFVGTSQVVDPNPYNMGGYAQPHPVSYDAHAYAAAQNIRVESSEEASIKLFNDDSISLSEYLKLTQRSVLNRCQDASTLMSDLQRPIGQFYCHVRHQQQHVENSKDKKEHSSSRSSSPLRSTQHRINFTSKRSINEKQANPIGRLMARLSLKEKPLNLFVDVNGEKTFENMGVQTIEYECDTCQTRNSRKHVDVGVQCTPETLEFSAQVTEDDFLSTARSALKNLLKQQSFASLTPAQILAQLSDNKDDKVNSSSVYDDRVDRSQEYDRRTQPAQDYERRDRNSGDFERRNDWNPRQFVQTSPQGQSGYPGRFNDPRMPQNSNQGGFAMGVGPRGPVPSLMGMPMGGLPHGPRPTHAGSGIMGGFNANRPNNPNQFGNQMGNYPMRRF